MSWIRDRALSLVLLALFAVSFGGQLATGYVEFNDDLTTHGRAPISFGAYLGTGHLWEATFENWESEFLQMAAFVLLTAFLYQVGSTESKRPGVLEPTETDPRRFADHPHAPWPVRRGGWVLWMYERSLGLALLMAFAVSWLGHAWSGWLAYQADQILNGMSAPSWGDYLTSSRFWFESFQNWQSEFLSIAAMVWLTIYLRQRGSPESKPVWAAHADTGR